MFFFHSVISRADDHLAAGSFAEALEKQQGLHQLAMESISEAVGALKGAAQRSEEWLITLEVTVLYVVV